MNHDKAISRAVMVLGVLLVIIGIRVFAGAISGALASGEMTSHLQAVAIALLIFVGGATIGIFGFRMRPDHS